MRHTRAVSDGGFASVLAPNTVLVESLGMQHWLNMALAERQSIAMNLQFPMPTRFMWQVARNVLGSSLIPEQSSYKREVLTWRIFDLIQSDAVIDSSDNAPISDYFSHLSKSSSDERLSPLDLESTHDLNEAKKLQFCRSLADVFEQYMLYRPDWLSAWENNRTIVSSHSDISEQDERWQACLWRLLVKQQAHHPASLHALAVDALSKNKRDDSWSLPNNVFVFAINTMAPQLVSFLDALAMHCEIHIFHLNPCVNYWGELQTEKQQLRQQLHTGESARSTQIEHWLDEQSDNILLSNMGQQGRDLFNLLQQQPSFEVSAFEAPIPSEDTEHSDLSKSLLYQVKQAVFEGRSKPLLQSAPYKNDPSIVMVKTHSPMRELQGLHDFLLDSLQKDKNLQPRDILIMCPAIENYAAFIPAVFSTSKDSRSSNRISCSVADRAPLDNMPEVAAFLTLLDITQSRFEVSTIIEYLRLPSIQKRFSLSEQELDIIVRWLSRARVHWGLNASHKQKFVDIQQPEDRNTWDWGLRRLLIGFAQLDQPVMQGELLTLPDVEGQQAEILGKLCLLLEQLQSHLNQLKQSRDIKQWQDYLLSLRQRFFSQDDSNERAIAIIERGIGELVNHCEMAESREKISIFVLRDALSHSFTMPDAVNQFMTGQVTFCSMLPMRSIPFKVVAMLGLNDGEYPRVSTPFSIDLMQSAPRRLGDRSRRGDDRYLFLESIISARQTLYLSYQSHSIKDNSERQPSLVLREFRDYLQQAFGDISEPEIPPYTSYTLPLHAFHPAHFDAKQTEVIPSYDQGWLRLADSILNAPIVKQPQNEYGGTDKAINSLPSSELVKALTDPLKYFAHLRLGLYFENNEPEVVDSEPFSIDGLSRYQMLEVLSAVELGLDENESASQFDETIASFIADGSVPDDMVSYSTYQSWLPAIKELQLALSNHETQGQSLSAQCNAVSINATLNLSTSNSEPLIVNSRVATMRSHHHLQVRIEQLVASIALSEVIAAKVFCLEPVNGELKCNTYEYSPIEPDVAMHVLSGLSGLYGLIQAGPQLLHCELGKMFTQHIAEDVDINITPKLTLAWDAIFSPPVGSESVAVSPINNDYLRWFFPHVPELDIEHIEYLLTTYRPIFSGIKKSTERKQKRGAKP